MVTIRKRKFEGPPQKKALVCKGLYILPSVTKIECIERNEYIECSHSLKRMRRVDTIVLDTDVEMKDAWMDNDNSLNKLLSNALIDMEVE